MKNVGNALKGTIVPLVTPFDAKGDIDEKAIPRLVDFLIAEGAGHLMSTALTGEGPLLTADEILRVWDKTNEAANGRTSLIASIAEEERS